MVRSDSELINVGAPGPRTFGSTEHVDNYTDTRPEPIDRYHQRGSEPYNLVLRLTTDLTLDVRCLPKSSSSVPEGTQHLRLKQVDLQPTAPEI